MNLLVLAPLLALVLVLVQFVVPGKPVYHYGWYNVAIFGLLIVGVYWWRAVARAAPKDAAAALVALMGTVAIGAAGIASGLFAPDDATVIASPGTSVPVADLGGALVFPLVAPTASDAAVIVQLVRRASSLNIAPNGARFAGAFRLQQVYRPVVEIEAATPAGSHLTITQPTGSAFLSPVLTLANQQTIAGMNLPFDTFAVPAVHRIVHAVLFDAQHLAMLHNVNAGESSAVLFDVDDDTGRSLPHGIRLVLDGERVAVGGLLLRPTVHSYPAVRIVAVPLPLLVVVGLALIAAATAYAIGLRRG